MLTSKLVKCKINIYYFLLNTPVLSLTNPVFYSIMLIFTYFNPLVYFLANNFREMRIRYILLRMLLSIYEVWSLTLLAVLAGTVEVGGMICGYMALGYISKQHYALTKNRTSSNLKRNISEYQMLRIQSLLANDCFQQVVAVPMIIVLVLICFLSYIFNKRQNLQNGILTRTAFYFFILIVANNYDYVLVAY